MKFRLLTLYFLMLLTSCGKRAEIYFIPDSVKSFTVFPVGSWWAYENDSLGLVDTLRLTDFSYEMEESSDQTYREYGEIVACYYSSNHFGPDFRISTWASTCVRVRLIDGLEVGLLYTEQIDKDVDCTFGGQITSMILPEVVINGVIYHDAIQSNISSFYPNGNQEAETFFAEDIGLIKWQLVGTDTIWELTNYFINR